MAESIRQPMSDEKEINLLDYWRVVFKYKWIVTVPCIISVMTAMIIGLQSPKVYESVATILIPKETTGGGILSALGIRGIASQLPGMSLPSLTPNRDIFLSILKSRTLAGKLVDQFQLIDHYKTDHVDYSIGFLREATDIAVSKEGVIEIRVTDKDPMMAANLANGYPEELDRLMSLFGTGKAGRQRRFIEARLAKTAVDLKNAEEALRRFQEKNKAFSLKEQAQGAIAVAARLKGEIIASEVQLQAMRNFATDSNEEVIRLKRVISELKRQLAQAQFGAGIELPSVPGNSGHGRNEIHLPASRFPEVGLDFARLARDLKIQEVVYSLLTQQLEQSKIGEAKDTTVVHVLDRAVPAINKSGPKIKLNMAIAGMVSLCLGLFLAFFLEYIQRIRNSEEVLD